MEARNLQPTQLRWVLATEKRRAIFIVILWGVALASIYAQALYQRSYMTIYDQAAILVVCLAAGAIMVDFSRALLGYIASMAIGLVLLFLTVTLPSTLGALPSPADVVVTDLWVSIVFKAVFPFPFVVFLIASLIGAGLGESYL